MFAPPGANPQIEDPRFPTPNLYDLVLQLSAEPGLDAWWAAVANIMHDHFKAERVTLAMPADPTDIENVPWGQKATFSMTGREEYVSESSPKEPAPQIDRPQFTLREPSGEAISDVRPQKLHPERLRPRLDARHSYSGQLRDAKEPNFETTRASGRPAGPQRSYTHAAGLPNPQDLRDLPLYGCHRLRVYERVLYKTWNLAVMRTARTLDPTLLYSLSFELSITSRIP